MTEKKAAPAKKAAKKIADPLEACSVCGKKVSSRGMRGHVRFAHESKKSVADPKIEAPFEDGESKKSKESPTPASRKDETPASKPRISETKAHWWFREIGGKKK